MISFAKKYKPVRQVPLNDNFRSSKGVVLPARKVIELNPERLPKKMESTDAQPYERGDILAMSFQNPDAEADWIAGRIEELNGTRFHDKPDQPARGLVYSDFAILLRSVRHDAQPILAALDKAGVKYVVGGMNGLFDTPEVAAIRSVFYFMADTYPDGVALSSADLTRIISKARLGLSPKQVRNGIRLLEIGKSNIGAGMDAELYLQRVYLDFLEAVAIREELIDAAEKEPARLYISTSASSARLFPTTNRSTSTRPRPTFTNRLHGSFIIRPRTTTRRGGSIRILSARMPFR